MGLFSKKSPEEKRIEKFNKTEKRSKKIVKAVTCRIWELYFLSTNEDEYNRTCDLFKEWISSYVLVQLPKLKFWGAEQYWDNFTSNYINGLLALMVLGQYEEANTQCDKLLEFEEIILEKKSAEEMPEV